MGLAGQKNKQRIGLDPQNKTWKNDQSKFGFKMLQKMGWSEGKGLGANEDGLREHVKVRLKEDNLGVGADRRSIDNWLDNNSAFDALLKGLNGSGDDSTPEPAAVEKEKPEVLETKLDARPAHGRLYHRKKFLRNKLVSNYDSKDLNMILGVKADQDVPSDSGTPTTESSDDGDAVKQQETPLLKIAATNVHDYFAQRMAAMGLAAGKVNNKDKDLEEDDRPSFGGLGLGAGIGTETSTTSGFGLRSFVKSTGETSVTMALGQNVATSSGTTDFASTVEEPSKKKKKSKGKEESISSKEKVKEKKSKKDKTEKKDKDLKDANTSKRNKRKHAEDDSDPAPVNKKSKSYAESTSDTDKSLTTKKSKKEKKSKTESVTPPISPDNTKSKSGKIVKDAEKKKKNKRKEKENCVADR
ncbi:hypothetical protein SpCBS45565_g07727 [Spizellomyces sp. 'palustris']|nr:hypothetical protein SpCBS45565_g07727 [Spizellomyces sp. 'palustris']